MLQGMKQLPQTSRSKKIGIKKKKHHLECCRGYDNCQDHTEAEIYKCTYHAHTRACAAKMQRIPPDAVAVAADDAVSPLQMLRLLLRKILLLCGFTLFFCNFSRFSRFSFCCCCCCCYCCCYCCCCRCCCCCCCCCCCGYCCCCRCCCCCCCCRCCCCCCCCRCCRRRCCCCGRRRYCCCSAVADATAE